MELNNYEKPHTQEKISSREKLLTLEKDGRFVFHGSPYAIEVLEPRQAHGTDDKTGQYEEDGKPAVFATQFADVAIFNALIEKDKTLENNFGINGDKLNFVADKRLIERARNKTGKVYVLDKSKFTDFVGMQCRSEKNIVPIEIVDVTISDLPDYIRIYSE